MKKYILLGLLILLVFSVHALDDDGDDMEDSWEIAHGLDPTFNDSGLDPDGDGLTNLEEYDVRHHVSDPQDADTDDDFYTDFQEYLYDEDGVNDTSIHPDYSLINFTLIKPRFGASATSSFDLKIATSIEAMCKFSRSQRNYSDIDTSDNFFSTIQNFQHTVEGYTPNTPDGVERPIYIVCRVKEGYTGNYPPTLNLAGYTNDINPYKLNLSVDMTLPKLQEAYADPSFVIENLEVDLVAETDDPSYCEFTVENLTIPQWHERLSANAEGFSTRNVLSLDKSSSPAIEDKKSYLFFTLCMNRAEKYTALKTISFDVNTSSPSKITYTYPTGYINSTDRIEVWTNRESECYYEKDGAVNKMAQRSGYEHYEEIPPLTEGEYSYPIECRPEIGPQPLIQGVVSFGIDSTPPSDVVIDMASDTCSNHTLQAGLHVDEERLEGYLYRFGGKENFTESNLTLTGLDLVRGQSYGLSVAAIDMAGNRGNWTTRAIRILKVNNNTRCGDNAEPEISVSLSPGYLYNTVNLTCTDDRNICSIGYATECDGCSNCTYTPYVDPFDIEDNVTLCYNYTDNVYSLSGSKQLTLLQCSNDEDGCCVTVSGNGCDPDCTELQDIDCSSIYRDSDMDNITDSKEIECGLDPNDPKDANQDYDGDGLTNLQECNSDYKFDILKKNTDNDPFTDDEEYKAGTDPADSSSYPKDWSKDLDNDGVPDIDEMGCGMDFTDPDDAEKDYDEDGLTNKEECGDTSINNPDTDGDTFSDYEEFKKETDPHDSDSYPESHLLSILLFVVGVGAIGGGIYLFTQDPMPTKPVPSNEPVAAGKPIVDFKHHKAQMKKEQFPPPQQPQQQDHNFLGLFNKEKPEYHPQRSSPIVIEETPLDKEIRRKRDMLRWKKINSVFDEFAEGREVVKPVVQKKEIKAEVQPPKKKKTVFDELDEIVERDKK